MAILSGLLSCRKQRHSNSVILLWYTIGDGNILRKGILSQIRPVKLTCLLIFISKAMLVFFPTRSPAACSVGWFVSLLVREEVLLAGLCERKILFRLKIYDRLRQATAKRTGCWTCNCDVGAPVPKVSQGSRCSQNGNPGGACCNQWQLSCQLGVKTQGGACIASCMQSMTVSCRLGSKKLMARRESRS